MLPTENPWPAAIALACMAIAFFGRFGSRRKVSNLIAGIVCVLLAGGCFLLDSLVLTPSEQVLRNVYELCNAVVKQDVPKALSFFSPQATERDNAKFALERMRVHNDLRISDDYVTFRGADSVAVSHFRANASISINIAGSVENISYHPTRWELDWQREGSDWKIIKVVRLHPITGKKMGFLSPQ